MKEEMLRIIAKYFNECIKIEKVVVHFEKDLNLFHSYSKYTRM